MWETWVRFLGWEDSLEKEMQPTPVFLPGESHGRRSLVGYSPRGRKELNTTERTLSLSRLYIVTLLFNLYAEDIMRNVGLEEAQVGIKIAGRSISNLRYADYTTLMAEREEELKSPLMKVKEESEKVGLELNIQKIKITESGPITSWQIDWETVETVTDFIFLGSKITADSTAAMKLKDACSLGDKL